jgi:ppGpp synthetase/RelA/SpoT-type nucleotidyltranferase
MSSHSQEFSKSQIDRAGVTLRALGMDPPLLNRATIETYEDAVRTVDQYRRGFADTLLRIRMGLSSFTRTLDIEDVAITQRTKRFHRIVTKLIRFPTTRLSQMQDIGGVRIVVEGLDVAERMSDHVGTTWNDEVVRHDDYISTPQSSGYRAHHIVVLRQRRPIEIQIRTARQHEWAVGVESASLGLGIELKWGDGPRAVRARFRSLAEVAAYLDRGEAVPPRLVALARAHGDPDARGIVDDDEGGTAP